MKRTPHWQERVAVFKKSKFSTDQSIVFAGDSICEQFDLEKHFAFRPLVNHGINGDHIDSLAERLSLSFAHRPRAFFFMIGINDLFDGCEFDMLCKRYDDLFAQINLLNMEKIPVFCFSILPVGVERAASDSIDTIRRINIFLQMKCSTARLDFLNIYPHFDGDEDCLEAEFTSDGIHLNEAGYTHWRRVLEIMDHVFLQPGADKVFRELM